MARRPSDVVAVFVVRGVVVGQGLDGVVVAADRFGRVEGVFRAGDAIGRDVGAIAYAVGNGRAALAGAHGVAVAVDVHRRRATELAFFGVGLQPRRALDVAAAVGRVTGPESVCTAALGLLRDPLAAKNAALGHRLS